MNSYIIRSKPHGKNRENEFKAGRISIGWPCGESFQYKNRKEISTILKSKNKEISEVSISMVDLFVRMPAGSIVLTPSIQDRALVHIFKTTSLYQYDVTADSDQKGNPHFIEAKYLKTVARKDLPEKVLQSLSGARKTLSQISQHYGLLENFIENDYQRAPKPTRTHPVIDMRLEAIDTLYSLLVNSNDENIRLGAARAIIECEV